VDQAREPLLASRRQLLRDNKVWAAFLSAVDHEPGAADSFTHFASVMQGVTLQQVRTAAAKWLGPEPMIATALPAASQGTK
jgi:hypothetical protein